MMPIGPLMMEHRLIEKMMQTVKGALRRAQKENRIDPDFVSVVTNFVRTYVERCHNGKEEDILFRALSEKRISEEHRKIMESLMEDHRRGRKIVKRLVEENERYRKGDGKALPVIMDSLKAMLTFYPKHIEKEERHFFSPIMGYFSEEEKGAMLREEYEFDSRVLHDQYEEMVGSEGKGPS